jgi:hypothetical protein
MRQGLFYVLRPRISDRHGFFKRVDLVEISLTDCFGHNVAEIKVDGTDLAAADGLGT